jgi:magnesium transporter
MGAIKEIKNHNLRWTYVTKTSAPILAQLKKEFNFSGDDLRDVPPPLQRQKVVMRPDYLFLILLFPVYIKETGEMRISEIDFFISKKYIVSINQGAELVPLRKFFHKCLEDKAESAKWLKAGSAEILFEILKRLQENCFPMLVHISSDIDAIHRRLFKEYEHDTINKILQIKTNIADFRRTAWGDEEIIKKLIAKGKWIIPISVAKKFDEIIEDADEAWSLLQTLTESVDALHKTNESLISFRTSEIMKTLTIFSVIVFPLTLLAAIFGMNVADMPFINTDFGFWKIIILMGAGAASMILYFKWRKWI